jgi:uroporphyrin-III C-methyltransferase
VVKKMSAKLYIISAPPSYDLMTMKAYEAIKSCDIVLYDRLIDESILKFVEGEVVYVGKKPYETHTKQKKINEIIEKYLKKGLSVARLKGGDAAFFSRAAEEIDVAKRLNVYVEWIAGVTSASFMCEKLRTSLTVRGVSNGVVFITGHTKEDKIETSYDWEAIVRLNMTVVVYMGIKNLNSIAKLLIENGMSSDTPVAVGMSLGFENESMVSTKLGDIESVYSKLSSPAVVVIGDVLKYAYVGEYKNG